MARKKWRKTKILIGVICFLVLAYWLYGVYVKNKWGQYLPSTDIVVNGVEREYHLFVPTDPPDGPMSLIVVAMGGDAGSWIFPQQSHFEELAEHDGIILAFPIGKLVPPNEGAWQLNTDAASRQDIDFIEAMIDEISTQHSIDPSRVYAIGYSLGSMFTYELACQMSLRFAAVASFAGTMPVSPKSCIQERNVPIMHIHGLDDPIIAYENTWDWKSWDSVGTMMDIPGLVQFWSDRYNCQNESQTESADSLHIVHDMCDENVRVEHHRVNETGHGWPENINGVPTYRVMWNFLSSYSIVDDSAVIEDETGHGDGDGDGHGMIDATVENE
jgi:polyhydroxybutyrate depolymerase